MMYVTHAVACDGCNVICSATGGSDAYARAKAESLGWQVAIDHLYALCPGCLAGGATLPTWTDRSIRAPGSNITR